MAGDGRPDAAETLRQQLDHLELQQEEQDTESPQRPPIQRPSSAAWPREHGPTDSAWRTSHDSRRESRVRFSEELPGRTENWPASRPQGARRSLHLDSQLYTIQSNAGARGARGHQSNQAQGGNAGIIHTEASSSRHLAPPSPDEARYSGSGSDNELPISPSHPRLHGESAFDGNFKDAIVTAAETNVTLANYRDWVARQRERQRRWTRGPTGRLKARFAPLYKRYIIEGLLRQKPLPPSKDGRHVPVGPGLVRRKPLTDERSGKPYVSNHIRSSRYTVWDFLPKQLFFQFSKLANFYFLVIGVMQMIPGLSTTGTYTTIGPLMAFVALSIGKEGYDDYRRYKLDKVENRKDAWVLDPDGTAKARPESRRWGLKWVLRRWPEKQEADPGTTELQGIGSDSSTALEPWSKVKWEDVRVGDIIRLRRDEDIPADIVLLQATGPNGVAYIETMALDGETNLKSKQACPLLADQCAGPSCLPTLDAMVVSEDPNLDLYNFDGRATVNGETMPLGMNQVVYRGSTLRNTNQAMGLVINTGEECKIRMNAHKNAHAKAPAMQSIVNRIVILLVFFVIMLSFGCTIGNELWKSDYEDDAWYLTDAEVPFKEIIIAFIIAFNTLIPLSLYVSLEIIKLGQFYLLHDVEMYDPVTNTPMAANTTTILENLGQVSYVFSDKTGTLTENIMRFRKMSVAGTAWLHDMDLQKEADERERKSEIGEKGKQKQESRPPTIHNQPRVNTGDGEQNPRRTSSVSQWRPTTRRGYAQPTLLKTEDFIQYLRQKPNTTFSRKARHFLLCIALCHTCLPETNGKGEVTFQAASPDELALVEAARDLGYFLIDRPPQSMKLQFRDLDGSDVEKSYEILDVIEFSSKRKRMSIIIRMPDGKICMFTKGADSAILPRLKLSGLAAQKASAVENRASKRKSVEQGKALQRRSTQKNTRNSINLVRAASGLSHRRSGLRNKNTKRSTSMNRQSSLVTDEVDSWLTRLENEDMTQQAVDDDAYQSPRASMVRTRSGEFSRDDPYDGLVDERLALNEGAVFERCFQHIDDFASEGLRTLLFAYRYLEEDDYKKWKPIYHDATTSLVNRQDRIEAAAELIEQSFDLAGVTAIEDKLQKGVPETVDKLRRADIKVWMLTGDKRETAINIAHSARICKPFSEVYILDSTRGDLQERIASTLIDVGRGMIPHSVVVIDGHTLGVVEDDESLKILFFDLVARVDSVICCRASPSQKATLVKCIRRQVPSSLTLAIGDGANDIAMIQASHVGIGISGREGLQAARISDYSIAQFRFLQRLLFVHGRWNYIRTGKYILGTFWKEIVFYLVQAQYQRYNGYTGTSLFEPASLTVFNTLFTSLPVILLGIFEQDLRAETLLALPELYTFGQKNLAFNFKLYLWWMFMAGSESIVIYHVIHGIYQVASFNDDTSIFAMGTLAFTVCVIFINVKMLVLEMHNQTFISLGGLLLSVGGWFLWNSLLSVVYPRSPGPYLVRDGFVKNFGRVSVWWLTAIVTLLTVIVFELAVAAVRRVFKPRDQDLMQELEHDAGLMDVMKEHAAERGEGEAAPVVMSEEKSYSIKVPNKAADAGAAKVSMTIATSEIASPRSVNGGASPGLPGKRASRHLTDEYMPPAFATPTEEREDPTDLIATEPTGKKGKAVLTPTRRWFIDTNSQAGGEGQDYFVQSPTDMRSPPLDGLQTPGESPRP